MDGVLRKVSMIGGKLEPIEELEPKWKESVLFDAGAVDGRPGMSMGRVLFGASPREGRLVLDAPENLRSLICSSGDTNSELLRPAGVVSSSALTWELAGRLDNPEAGRGVVECSPNELERPCEIGLEMVAAVFGGVKSWLVGLRVLALDAMVLFHLSVVSRRADWGDNEKELPFDMSWRIAAGDMLMGVLGRMFVLGSDDGVIGSSAGTCPGLCEMGVSWRMAGTASE